MAYYESCKECKHNTGNWYSAYCMGCCFSSKFEKKEEEKKMLTREKFIERVKCLAAKYDLRCIFAPFSESNGLTVRFIDNYTNRIVLTYSTPDAARKTDRDFDRLDVDLSYASRRYGATEAEKEYIKNDIQITENLFNRHYGLFDASKAREAMNDRKAQISHVRNERYFGIKKVIFNDPATIVFWQDGSKTVVKCQEGDIFDPEKGLAMAISKRALGDNRDYYKTFLKRVPKEFYAHQKELRRIAQEIADKMCGSDSVAFKVEIEKDGQ